MYFVVMVCAVYLFFFFSSRRRHTRWNCDWSSDVCSSDLPVEACTGDDYALPAVSIASLDADGSKAAEIGAALDAHPLQGANAMTAALAGGLRIAARAKARTGHVIQTILVTDGSSDPCGGDIASAAMAAGNAFQTDHLETYVLGIGPNAATLDPIAVAGGTFHAYTAA